MAVSGSGKRVELEGDGASTEIGIVSVAVGAKYVCPSGCCSTAIMMWADVSPARRARS